LDGVVGGSDLMTMIGLTLLVLIFVVSIVVGVVVVFSFSFVSFTTVFGVVALAVGTVGACFFGGGGFGLGS
jgi:hypothetical protein